jgi:ubiquitin-protein ligase
MNRAQGRMYRMIQNFQFDLNGTSIGEYFQVPMKIIVNYPDMLNITCTFYEKINHKEIYIKLELPFEINCLVLSYLYKYSFGEYQIIVPDDYPFKPPFWVLINTNDTNKKNKNQISKYKKAEMIHNTQYRNSWEPSISFEKDILYMIQLLLE